MLWMARRNAPARKSGMGPCALNLDMMSPRPNTDLHWSAESGGTPGTTMGPRTSLKADHGRRIVSSSLGARGEPRSCLATGGTKVAWYTTSPRLFWVRSVAFHVRRLGSSSLSSAHDMAMPSKVLRSSGVCSDTDRAPVKPPPSVRHLPAHTRHARPARSAPMLLLLMPPITTSSTRSNAPAAASGPPRLRSSRSQLTKDE
mmetsp:Transcript_1774/g.4017  ORF Transcript_1774/g.4017 Transcript_1774/m.4017 type:complete len:201 (+) Transcript_1774:812-1414(+)